MGHWALVISLSLLPTPPNDDWERLEQHKEHFGEIIRVFASRCLPFLVRYCIKIKLTLIKILVGIAIMRQSLYGSAYKRSN
jgi:hypothetical protein